jgi:hypothetical protein
VSSGGLENPSISITPNEQQHLGCDLGLSRRAILGPGWVKRRNTRCEQMFSALAPTTDIAQQGRHVCSVPIGDIPLLAYKEEARQLRAYLLSSFAMTASKDWSTN